MTTRLREAKATGESSNSIDPVTPAGGKPRKRRADLSKDVSTGKKDNVEGDVTALGPNDEGLKEDEDFDLEETFGSLFVGNDLSEEFKENALIIFEAAVKKTVDKKVAEKELEMKEHYESLLDSELEESINELIDNLDGYLSLVSENWMKENRVEIESNIKVEVAESLLDGVKGLIYEHNLDLDETSIDIESKLSEAKDSYNKVFNELTILREKNEELEKELAFTEITEGLTATQAAKLGMLTESISYNDIKDYVKKVETIKENYFKNSGKVHVDEAEYLEEEVIVEDTKTRIVDSNVNRYVEALKRSERKY